VSYKENIDVTSRNVWHGRSADARVLNKIEKPNSKKFRSYLVVGTKPGGDDSSHDKQGHECFDHGRGDDSHNIIVSLKMFGYK